VVNLRYHRFLCINRSAFSQQQSFCKILLIKCFKDILTLHKTKETEDARISASFCFVQHQKYDSKEKPGELVVKILTSLTHKITWINLNKTKTLSSVPSNSSSDVPLFPARSFSSKNFAISSAGRFYQMENKIRNLGSQKQHYRMSIDSQLIKTHRTMKNNNLWDFIIYSSQTIRYHVCTKIFRQ